MDDFTRAHFRIPRRHHSISGILIRDTTANTLTIKCGRDTAATVPLVDATTVQPTEETPRWAVDYCFELGFTIHGDVGVNALSTQTLRRYSQAETIGTYGQIGGIGLALGVIFAVGLLPDPQAIPLWMVMSLVMAGVVIADRFEARVPTTKSELQAEFVEAEATSVRAESPNSFDTYTFAVR